MQIVDCQHGELLEGGSSSRVAGAVPHALLAVSDPDGGAQSGEVSGLLLAACTRQFPQHDWLQR